MARKPQKNGDLKPTKDWLKWSHLMAKANKDFEEFAKAGGEVVHRYRLEANRAANQQSRFWRDKYNILYSSTETIRPSLYAQTPKPQVDPRLQDTTAQEVVLASMLLEQCLSYAVEDLEFDSVMENVILDYLLPGLGIAWVHYVPEMAQTKNAEGAEEEYVAFEGCELQYVHYKDIRFIGGRVWEDIWAIARKTYLHKEEAIKRFGKEKAAKLSYTHAQDETTRSNAKNNPQADADQAIVWEIWDKRDRKVIWWCDDCNDVLDVKDDPLRLKNFWPCPKPLRAIFTTDSFMPKSFFTQYRQQAETLDDITMRIRILTDALRVVGVYDQSQEALSRLLTGTENKMVAVENWTQFASTGGMNGSIQFLPIKEVALVLTELYRQREIAKAEIYEITGFSDIVRGVSKASETLGAQEIKNQWAGSRLRMLQKEVQRFCRDIIAIVGEIIAEQFSDESLMLYSGFTPPPITPEEQQQIVQATQAALLGQQVQPPVTMQQQAMEQFKAVVQLLRSEKLRCAKIDIETDSTIQPDEAAERKDRMDFLGAMGAFLQQAGPMAMQYPDMRGLLGAMMMFTARTFRASRPIEKEFETFTKTLQAQPPMDPNGNKEGGDDGQSKIEAAKLNAQTTVQVATIKRESDQQQSKAEADLQRYEIDRKMELEKYKIDREATTKDRELTLREREVAVKEAELGLKRDAQDHQQSMDIENADREDERLEIDAKQREAEQNAPKGD